MIRPKLFLAQDGNYREARWFTAWANRFHTEDYILPDAVQKVTGQKTVPIGEGYVQLNDTAVGVELCEELFTPYSPHIVLGLNGVEIITNGSGSHHELRKLDTRVSLIMSAVSKCGGVYLYSNQQGCDGDRLYYDGCSMIALNSELLAQGTQFSIHDVEVIDAVIDLDEVVSRRASFMSRSSQAASSATIPHVSVDFDACMPLKAHAVSTTCPIKPFYHKPEEEIAFGPACWLWDYLRRSKLSGFFLPLSGGADSAAVAAIVGSMCQMVVFECNNGNQTVIDDVRTVTCCESKTYIPSDPRELANKLLVTCYMGTANSSNETRLRAENLANEIGSFHKTIFIDKMVSSVMTVFSDNYDQTPRFKVHGGTNTENLALQNVQARSRMLLSYLLAQLTQWTRKKRGGLLVLSSGNVDECLRGYLTKYDCSSGDLNPIGAVSKVDLKRFLRWSAKHLGYTVLDEIAGAPPTAELEPITSTYTQVDEEDMGMTYEELSQYGRLRKIARCGPLSMYHQLLHEWNHLSPSQVASKVKFFFRMYAINRHKMTTVTPSYHAEAYSPDDNRFDLRQFLYNASFPYQFKKIDEHVEIMEEQLNGGEGSSTGSSSSSHAKIVEEMNQKRTNRYFKSKSHAGGFLTANL
eukprot:TRINITY_DN1795_c0_g1_i3.p1 TRINITY_DN1795_c0_g1~~TRINITY_DN1795_c0_g1_i3.p1  ORF type:complete len:636 (+),score=202.23 TRINITY_DN1795_c0_g1_i3:272-2179(+)